MRIKFDEKMRQSNEWYIQEQMAAETARRIAQQNEYKIPPHAPSKVIEFTCFFRQIMDLLLDMNNSAQLPAEKRIDLFIESPSLSTIPPLVTTDDLSKAAELDTPEGKALYHEIRAMLEEKAAVNAASRPRKSLANLVANVPHLSLSSPHVAPELLSSFEARDGQPGPMSYLTQDQVDDYIYEIDASLGTVPAAPPHFQALTQQDLALQNPHSVYNWLRQHEPKIFLQDGEGSEKSSSKPNASRGAGKRASLAAPVKAEPLEFVEEDGIGYDASAAGPPATKGKRKREEDDGGYHPKSGLGAEGKVKKPRQSKKKAEGSGETPAKGPGRGKRKPKIPSPAPDAHPFGPI